MTDRESPRRPALEVISGAWVSAPDWLDLPQTIRARSPNDRNTVCRVRTCREDVNKAANARRRQPAYEFWSILAGRVPPVPHQAGDDADKGLTSLFDAHACFRGLRRPIAEDANGADCIAYVIKPKFFFRYQFRPPLVLTEKCPVPVDLVYVAYVRLDEPSVANPTKGVLSHWQFVESAPEDPMLPIDFQARYDERLW
jgi:hypothetical protein